MSRQIHTDEIKETIKTPDFKSFANEAYHSKDGYAIRTNPNTLEKEMFIAGTKSLKDVARDVGDTMLFGADKLISTGINSTLHGLGAELDIPIPKKPVNVKLFSFLDFGRSKKQKFYEDIAEQNGVHTIYGHSLGGAMLADMNIPYYINKVGLDSAMLIAHNTKMLNLNEGGGLNPMGVFDDVIGFTGEDNEHFDNSIWKPHQVW